MIPTLRTAFLAMIASTLAASPLAGLPQALAEASIDKGNSGLLGINYAAGPKGYPRISDIYKGSPAEKAGLKKGDEIEAIDKIDTRYTGYLHMQTLLGGASGTAAILTVHGKNWRIKRAPLDQFQELSLKKSSLRKWQEGPESQVKDLPFALLARVGNKPTLFEFVAKADTSGITELLKKHNDGAYILSQCKVVRLSPADPAYAPLCKYFGFSSAYALLPVYSPWLVTVKVSDILTTLPAAEQLDKIAANLVHHSIKAQVSPLQKNTGLAHKNVIKRICEAMPAGSGVAGLGFGAAPDGEAIITEVFKGGPAEKANLKPGDEIRTVNGEETKYLGLEHIQSLLVGKPGQTIKLSIGRNQTAAQDKKAGATDATEGSDSPREVSLTLAPYQSARFSKLKIAVWKREASSDPDDADEFELPCCMVGRAQAKPTIFEFCLSENEAGIKSLIEKLKVEKKLPADLSDVQVVRLTPKDSDYAKLHQYFHLKSEYACLPIYSRSRHKTLKANQIKLSPPTQTSEAQHIIGLD